MLMAVPDARNLALHQDANRSLDKAQELARIATASGSGGMRGCGYAELAGQTFDVVFNATSATLHAELPPVPASVFAPGVLAYQLAYGKGLTPFLRLGRRTPARSSWPTAWACWPSRLPRPLNDGAACGPTPGRSSTS